MSEGGSRRSDRGKLRPSSVLPPPSSALCPPSSALLLRAPSSVINRPQGLRRVFDQRHAILRAQRGNRLQIGTLTIQMHHHHRPRKPATLRPVCQRLGQQRRIQVPTLPLTIQKHRPSTFVHNRVSTRGKGQRRTEHLIARPYPDELQRQVQGSRAGRERGGVKVGGRRAEGGRRRADVGGRSTQDLAELALEAVDVRAEGGDPVRGKGLLDEPQFIHAHMRRGEVNFRGLHGTDDGGRRSVGGGRRAEDGGRRSADGNGGRDD